MRNWEKPAHSRSQYANTTSAAVLVPKLFFGRRHQMIELFEIREYVNQVQDHREIPSVGTIRILDTLLQVYISSATPIACDIAP
jgi:hypothetical protein